MGNVRRNPLVLPATCTVSVVPHSCWTGRFFVTVPEPDGYSLAGLKGHPLAVMLDPLAHGFPASAWLGVEGES